MNFGILSLSLRLHKLTIHTDTCTSCYRLEILFSKKININNNLNIINCRSIIQSYKTYLLTSTAGTYPSFHVNSRTKSLAFKYIYNFCSNNGFHFLLFF